MLSTNLSYLLPKDLMGICCHVAPKAVSYFDHKFWIRQPLLSADVFEAELHLWQYCTMVDREGVRLKSNSSLFLYLKLNMKSVPTQFELL